MTRMAVAFRWFFAVLSWVAVPLVALTAVLAAVQPGLDWVVAPALVGGVALAGALFILHRRRPEAPARIDTLPLGRATMMNISHVSVAGFGGLGVIVASWFVAAQYDLLTAALLVAVTGGVLGGWATIRYRRAHPHTARAPRTLRIPV